MAGLTTDPVKQVPFTEVRIRLAAILAQVFQHHLRSTRHNIDAYHARAKQDDACWQGSLLHLWRNQRKGAV
eukprot:47526-Amphidinium_carterae.2